MLNLFKFGILRCIDCNQILPLTLFYEAPEYVYDETIKDFHEIAVDDRKDFMLKHSAHRQESLFNIPDSLVSNYRYGEPIREDYFQATNQKQIFLIKRWRLQINEPMKYSIIQGWIKPKKPEIKVQKEAIRKVLKQEAGEMRINDWQIDTLIKCLQVVAENNTEFNQEDMILSDEHPMIYYVCLSEKILKDYAAYCCDVLIFLTQRNFMETFIRKHNYVHDVMALQIRRRFEIVLN